MPSDTPAPITACRLHEFEREFRLWGMAPEPAGTLSVDPHGIGPHTRVRGRGVMARTRQAAS